MDGGASREEASIPPFSTGLEDEWMRLKSMREMGGSNVTTKQTIPPVQPINSLRIVPRRIQLHARLHVINPQHAECCHCHLVL